jgi:hypothetical protein
VSGTYELRARVATPFDNDRPGDTPTPTWVETTLRRADRADDLAELMVAVAQANLDGVTLEMRYLTEHQHPSVHPGARSLARLVLMASIAGQGEGDPPEPTEAIRDALKLIDPEFTSGLKEGETHSRGPQ